MRNPRAPIAPEQVKIYLEPPAEFEVIGLVNASSDAGWTEQGSLNYAIKELKKQAATLGANGVLIVTTGETTSVRSPKYVALFSKEFREKQRQNLENPQPVPSLADKAQPRMPYRSPLRLFWAKPSTSKRSRIKAQ